MTNYTKEDFEVFHKENLEVYEMFKKFSFEVSKRNKNYSARGIFHRIRWETSVNSNDTSFKINNNWTPHYARKFMEDFPELEGFFRVRKDDDPKFK